MISFFLERTRRKVRSFWGSMSRMVVLAFIRSWWISPAYWTVLVLSRVVFMGIPEEEILKLTLKRCIKTKHILNLHIFSSYLLFHWKKTLRTQQK